MSPAASSTKPLNTSQYGSEHDGSSVSSRTSSPDPNQRRDSNSSGATSTTTTPQMNFLQKQKEMRERESQVSRFKVSSRMKILINQIFLDRVECLSHHLIHRPAASTISHQFHQEASHHPFHSVSQALKRSPKFRFAPNQQTEMVSLGLIVA